MQVHFQLAFLICILMCVYRKCNGMRAAAISGCVSLHCRKLWTPSGKIRMLLCEFRSSRRLYWWRKIQQFLTFLTFCSLHFHPGPFTGKALHSVFWEDLGTKRGCLAVDAIFFFILQYEELLSGQGVKCFAQKIQWESQSGSLQAHLCIHDKFSAILCKNHCTDSRERICSVSRGQTPPGLGLAPWD